MLFRELDERLLKIKDKRLASEVRRFLINLFILFDGEPPVPILDAIHEILDILEAKSQVPKSKEPSTLARSS